jgi:hypothetical protein
MKLRFGFVSNSSSTSFSIYGVFLDDMDEVRKFLNAKEEDDTYELIDALAEKNGLEYHCDPNDEGYYVGIPFTQIGDNETGREFKEKVAKKLKEVFGVTQPCSDFTEGWYDG